MPVAVPLVSRAEINSTSNLIESGFVTRDFPENNFNVEREYDEGFSEEDEEEEDDEVEDYSSEDDEEEEQEALLISGARSNGLFEEYFDYEPTVINRDRSCNHQVSSRPCPFCAPKVSMRLANEVRIAFKALFSPKAIKFDYVPLDRALIDNPFKSLKALHDLTYVKKVLNEIINLLVTVQNIPNYKINYGISSALLRIHDRTESLLDEIRGSGKLEEYRVVHDFQMKLNAVGLVHGSCKENSYQNCSSLMDCQR